MRRPLAVALVALAALLVPVAVFVRSDEGPGRSVGRAGAALAPRASEPAAFDAQAPGSAPLQASARTDGAEPLRTELAAGKAELETTADPLAIVIGRVVDVDGAPIDGARVRLAGLRSWAEGHDVARLPGRSDWYGFEATTSADGAFRIEAPPPTAEIVTLRVEPDRFHDSFGLGFGSSAAESVPRLAAGVRDVGEIRLGVTGAISGRVTDNAGRPLADVRITIGSSRHTTLGHEAFTEGDGTYLLAHAPLGTYGVNAKVVGYLAQFIEPITVEARRETAGFDFALGPAPTLEGRVVDEHGTPIAGARIWGWPAGGAGGSGAGATSDADGRFMVSLPQDEPYTLGAKLAGHHPWGNEFDYANAFPAGTRDIQVVLRSMPLTRFHVVDTDSGEPIERFGLQILADNGSLSEARTYTERRAPPLRDHPGGWAEASARPGIDLFVVAAEGYLMNSGDVEHAAADEPTQTLRLQRGATLVGRVLRDGTSVVGAVVQVAPARVDGQFVDGVFTPVYGPGADTRRARSARTDTEGRFEVTGISGGMQRVRVQADQGAPLVRMPVAVKAGTNDVGDLHMTDGATIAGVVLLPPGVLPIGLEVVTGERSEEERVPLDSAGRFRFEGLAAAQHALRLAPQPGLVAPGASATLELTAGRTHAVTIDAQDRGMSEVALTVLIDGRPAQGCSITLEDLASTDRPGTRLGSCDDEGRATGFVRAFGAAGVKVNLEQGHSLVHAEPLELLPGKRVFATLEFELVALHLRFPSSVKFATDGWIRLELVPSDGEGVPQTVRLHLRDGALPAGGPGLFTAPSELRIASLPAGRWRLTVEVCESGPYSTLQTDEHGNVRRVTHQPEPTYRASADLLLVPGEAATLNLE